MTRHGWVKKHRKVMDSLIWTDPYKYKLFDELTMLAQFEDGEYQFNGEKLTVSSGQLVTGRDALASIYNRGARPVHQKSSRLLWKWIKQFEKDGMLTIKSTTKYSVISITNYGYYQQTDQQKSIKGPSKVQLESTYKNLKNLENEKNKSVGKENPSTNSAFALWQNVWGFPNAIASQDLQNWVEEFGDELVGWVIQYAARRDVQNRAADKYLDRVFDGYRQRGITTVTQAETEAAEHEKVAKANAPRSHTYSKPIRQEAKPDWLDKPYVPSDEPEDPALHEEIAAKLAKLRKLREGKAASG